MTRWSSREGERRGGKDGVRQWMGEVREGDDEREEKGMLGRQEREKGKGKLVCKRRGESEEEVEFGSEKGTRKVS